MLSFESQSRQILGKICEELALNPGEKGFFCRVLDRSSARPFFATHPNVAGKHGSLPANQQHGWELQTAGKVVQYKVFPSLFFHLACIGRFRCSHWPSSATWWPKQQQWLRRSAARASVDFQTWFSPLVQGGKYVVQKRETKAINKLCVREILSLSFVCGAYFFEFRGRNLVCFGIAYNFDGGRHWQALANSRRRQGRHACALRFSRVSMGRPLVMAKSTLERTVFSPPLTP